jgi:hypothetical protein
VGEIINNNKNSDFSIDFKKDSNKQMRRMWLEEAGKSWKGFFCLLILDG